MVEQTQPAIFSIVLEKNYKFENGRMFLKISRLKDNFLGSGFTSAVLRIPEVRTMLTISVITGKSSGRNVSTTNLVGKGLSTHNVLEDALVILSISI